MAKATFVAATTPKEAAKSAPARPRRAADPNAVATRAIAGRALNETEAKMVKVNVPTSFKLTDDNHEIHNIAAGTTELREDFANHFYAKANGVTLK